LGEAGKPTAHVWERVGGNGFWAEAGLCTELARLATWAERRLGPKCKRPLKSGLDQSGETGAVVLRTTAIYQRPNASIGDKSLEIVGSIERGCREMADPQH
jgi:hypothetical protein